MLRIHVRLNFEHKPGEGGLLRLHRAVFARTPLGRRRMGHEPVKHFPNTEIPEGRAEVNRGLGALEKSLRVEAMASAGNQLHLVPQRFPIAS